MQFTFADALRELGPNAAFQIINQARTPANYLFGTILPERTLPSYEVKSGSLTIRPLMAGLVAMDSPYPETGAMDTSTFLAQSAKIANRVSFPEAALRTLQQFIQQMQLTGGNSREAVVSEVYNFTAALLVQPHLDTAEWLRGQALLGKIDWTFNKKRLLMDYGVPSANKLTLRTTASNDAYGGTSSKFWADNQAALKLLKYNRRAVIMHPDTFNDIIANPANNIQVVASSGDAGAGRYSLVRMIQQNGVNVASPDMRDRVDIITYGLEGEMLDPATGKTVRIPFLKAGYVIHLGQNSGNGYVVGAGSQRPANYELGYTHIAPTVESGGQAGRWARVYTPENEPWSLRGEAAENSLPVIESPDKLVIAQTELQAA